MKKSVIIGLDGASLDFVLKWVVDRELPVFEKILPNSFYSELESIISPWTAPAWTSLTTGKNPGKHGIFDFFKFKDNGYEKKLVSSHDIHAKQIWDYLSENKLESIVINVPITYPPKKVNGILIPGYLAPESPECYPPGILKEFEEIYGKYKVYSDCEIENVSPEKKLEGFIDLIKLRKNALLHFSSKYQWNFLMVVFQKTDTVFHEVHNEEQILKLYKEVDATIGEFLQVIGSDVNVLIVSDHGMGVHKWNFYPNTWLKEKGLLKSGESKSENPSLGIINLKLDESEPTGLDDSMTKLIKFLQSNGLNVQIFDHIHWFVKKTRLSFLLRLVPKTMINAVLRQEKAIDYTRTKAFYRSSTCLGIRINLKGREPAGIIDNKEYNELRGYLLRELKNLRHPNREKVFEKVLPREECYSGNYVQDAPDVMILPRNMDYSLSDTVRSKAFMKKEHFNHKMNGLFIAFGPDIKKCKNKGRISLLDIAPTILHLFGLTIPDDMDGRVLTEVFREDSKSIQQYVKDRAMSAMSGEDKERIKEKISRLKSLTKI